MVNIKIEGVSYQVEEGLTILEAAKKCGYEIDIIEFVDFAHSPKNLMLRCKLKKSTAPDLTDIENLMATYGFTQKLYDLVKNQED